MRDKRILVLSRDPALVISLKKNLPARGYQFIYTDTFDDDLRESLKALRPDLVLLDTVAPRHDRIELYLRMRHMFTAPILVLNSSRIRKDSTRLLYLGAKGNLPEPISFTDLMRRIEEAAY